MSRKVILICCFALAQTASLGPDYSPAISYSSIRFGSSSIEKNSSSKFTETQTTNENPIYYRVLDTIDSQNIDVSKTAPTYTEAIFRNAPIESQAPAKPVLASRNIPLSPSPEFASVPSVLKTEGLSAYASFPLETLVPKVYSASIAAKSVNTLSGLAQGAAFSPLSLPVVRKSEGRVVSKEAHVSYSEPTISHVIVSSSGINYSW